MTDGSGRRGSVAWFLRTVRGRLTVAPPSGSGLLPAQIEGVDTSNAAFVGSASSGAPAAAVEVRSLVDYDRAFGSADGELRRAVRLFFDNGGKRAVVAGTPGQLSDGLDLLNNVRFSILAIPDAGGLDPGDAAALLIDAVDLCEERRAFLVVDPPAALALGDALAWVPTLGSARNAAAYFPRMLAGGTETAASGAVAGVYARTDLERGVWKAPAREAVRGMTGLTVELTDGDVATANAASLNVIRSQQGLRIWGARTLSSDPEWKYVNVRRLALFIERSISEGLQWAAFEPNTETLWNIVRTSVDAFMQRLFQQGAFEAAREEDAYFVRCDRTTMTQDDIDNGRLIVVVGFAPARPAEFVVVRGRLNAPREDPVRPARPLRGEPDQAGRGGDMDVIEIKTYEYYVFSSREAMFFVNTVILLYGANSAFIGAVWFKKDNTAALDPATKNAQGWYTLYYSYVDLPVIIDMLRNEKPVYLIFDTSENSALNARISTLQEPVGEGEQ